MTLMPVMSPVAQLELLGSWIYSASADESPDWDFTSLDFLAGDLLVAIIVLGDGDGPFAPSGFTMFESLSGANVNIAVSTKVATGSETTFVNNEGETTVATMALRNAVSGASASAGATNDPPQVFNDRYDMVFSLFGSRTDETSVAAPSDYTLLGSEFNALGNSLLALAYRPFAPANENPAAWGGTTANANVSAATFSFTKA